MSYWKRQLADLTVLELPTDRPRTKMQSYLGSYKSLFISRELVEALNIVSRREHLTVFMTMTAALQVLLYRSVARMTLRLVCLLPAETGSRSRI